MKSPRGFTCLALIASFFPGPNAPAQDKPKFKAGAAAVDISPDVFPFELRSGPSSYVHDPIMIRALAFENGEKGRCLIAVLDAIGVSREMADEAKQVVAAKTGWDPESIMIAATHEHSTPKGGTTSPGRAAFDKKKREGLAEVLLASIEALQSAQVGFPSDEEASEVRNRRNASRERWRFALLPLLSMTTAAEPEREPIPNLGTVPSTEVPARSRTDNR